MFRSARLKLASLYLVIIMTISIFFSFFIYNTTLVEVERVLKHQAVEFYAARGLIPPPPNFIQINPDLLIEARRQIVLRLLTINLIILGISGGIGYILSGKTLAPIEAMVDQQKRFISDASHELRTPLTALKSELEVNLRDKELTPQRAKEILMSNLEEVNNLQMLSDNLLRLTQYEDARGWDFVKVSLQKVIADAWVKVAPLANQRQIAFESSVKNEYTIGDAFSLTELFMILFDNAIKYSPKKSTVRVSAKAHDASMKLFVSDEGIGIPQENIPHIFDRFYRSDSSRSKHSVTGYGLGLSIAQKIIRLHKGSISVDSTIGRGTTFTLKLPHVKEA